MGTRSLILGALSVLAGACGTPPMLEQTLWAPDGESFERLPFVRATNAPIDGALLSLRTWPEMEEVAAVVSVEEDGSNESVATLAPAAPRGARWYVIRCADDVPSSLNLDSSIPLSDGSHVWRFFGVPFPPEVVRIFEPSVESPSIDVQIEFSTDVEPADGLTPDDVATVTQDGVECHPWIAGDSIGSTLYLQCSPALDWKASFRLQLQGLQSFSHGDPVAPLDLTLGGTSSPSHELVLPRARPAPPGVPADLCAGVDCE